MSVSKELRRIAAGLAAIMMLGLGACGEVEETGAPESSAQATETAAEAQESSVPEEIAGEESGAEETSSETAESAPETETTTEAPLTSEPEETITAETTTEATTTEAQPTVPEDGYLWERNADYLQGTWNQEDGTGYIQIFDGNGFTYTDQEGNTYSGTLVYTETDDGGLASGPRWDMLDFDKKHLTGAPYIVATGNRSDSITLCVGMGAEVYKEGCAIVAVWAEGMAGFADYYKFTVDDSEYGVEVLFSPIYKVRDVKLLSLDTPEEDKNGDFVFPAHEIWQKDVLYPDKPLIARMSFPGSIPNTGISYMDDEERIRTFSISESGFDGSIIFTEIKTREADKAKG